MEKSEEGKGTATSGQNAERTQMTQQYSFPLEGVIRLLEHAAQAVEHYHPYHKEWDAPGLLLVGDNGVYLMSNGVPRLADPAGDGRSFVVYASGFDPHQDPDWYANKMYMFGGDDDVEFLPLEGIKANVEEQRNAGADSFTMHFANEPAGEAKAREICGIIGDDPESFINLLLKEPRNVRAMAAREPKLITIGIWSNLLRQISRDKAEAVLNEPISKRPEDERWLCRRVLDLCYDPSVSMDQIYGKDGLEEAFARELKAHPEDRLNALKRAFESLK